MPVPFSDRSLVIRTKVCAAAALAALLAINVGCGARESTLRALLLWPGDASCTACRANAVDLMRHTGGSITLLRESPYTVEAQFDVGEGADRCIYYMFFSASWDIQPGPPTHDFQCTPIGSTVTSAGSTVGARGDDGRMRVRVAEFSLLERELVLEHFAREFDVDWAPH